jgi:hypothetical protein
LVEDGTLVLTRKTLAPMLTQQSPADANASSALKWAQ